MSGLLQVIEGQGTQLCVSPDGALSFHAVGGAVWKTAGPLCVVHYYDRQHPRPQQVSVPRSDTVALGTAGTPSLSAEGLCRVSEGPAGTLAVTIELAAIDLRIVGRLLLHETGDGFTFRLDAVHEGRADLYRLLGIELLPMFGAARTGEEGYLVLPNWLGCQTYFDKEYPREVWQTIYSSNDEWENVCNMGMFGIVRQQGTLCGIVSEGDDDARLVCRAHWEGDHLNAVHPYLVYRWQEDESRLPGQREVRYHVAPRDHDAGEGYAYCGVTYRQFLRENRGLQTFVEKQTSRPAAEAYRNSFMLKIFMGYKDPCEDGKGAFHPTCTFDEARAILEDLRSRGVERITAILVGWNQDGHDGMYPTRFPVDERLGGEAGLKRLNAWCREHEITVAVHDNQGSTYSCSPEFDLNEVIQHRNGQTWGGIVWSGGRCFILSPAVAANKYAPRDMARLAELGLHGHHHIDAVGSFMPDHAPNHPLPTRRAYMNEVRKIWQLSIDHLGSASTEYPFGPYFDLVDGYFVSYSQPYPWHRASALATHFLDRTVPLVPIVLHGSLKCCEPKIDDDAQLMHLLSLGLAPQAEVCERPAKPFGISTYAEQVERIVAAYRLFHDARSDVSQLSLRTIERYCEVEDGSREIHYDDGSVLIVHPQSDQGLSYRLSVGVEAGGS